MISLYNTSRFQIFKSAESTSEKLSLQTALDCFHSAVEQKQDDLLDLATICLFNHPEILTLKRKYPETSDERIAQMIKDIGVKSSNDLKRLDYPLMHEDIENEYGQWPVIKIALQGSNSFNPILDKCFEKLIETILYFKQPSM